MIMESIVRVPVSHGFSLSPFCSIISPLPSSSGLLVSPNLRLHSLKSRVRVSGGSISVVSASFRFLEGRNRVITTSQNLAKAMVLAIVTAVLIGKRDSPVRAEPPPALTEEMLSKEEQESERSALTEFLESHSEAVDALKNLLQRRLEEGEDAEALKILKRLVSAQPTELEWKFLMARLLNEMGELDESRKVLEKILSVNPLSFEALFENALLMDRCGEGRAVLERLEEALKIAKAEEKEKEARDVKLIMAQIKFLQKNVDEALDCYQQLVKEDPKDYRPYFCQGVIYSLLDRNKEAREKFAKYRELSPKKFEVEGYLQTPLSRMKLFGSDPEN